VANLAASTAPLEAELRTVGGLEVRRDHPLKRYTTFGIGGAARLFVEPRDQATLVAALEVLARHAWPWMVIGQGSNLLVSDEGYDGAVIRTVGALKTLRIEGRRLYAEAGVPLKKACNAAAQAGLSGLEFAISIPGSIGGAVTMNAGAHGSQTAAVVERVAVWQAGLGVVELGPELLQFGYRWSRVQVEPWVVLQVVLRLEPDDPARVLDRMNQFMAYRLRTQPVGERNAGSMFKNPEGATSGALIEAVGAKGWREGDAHVSTRHANFIINDGAASARDVLTLMRRVRRAVRERFGIVLKPEVRWVGPPAGEAGTTWDNLWLPEDADCPAPSG
jgi:UDP-N-acetylmuramate dehydrogenase